MESVNFNFSLRLRMWLLLVRPLKRFVCLFTMQDKLTQRHQNMVRSAEVLSRMLVASKFYLISRGRFPKASLSKTMQICSYVSILLSNINSTAAQNKLPSVLWGQILSFIYKMSLGKCVGISESVPKVISHSLLSRFKMFPEVFV